MPRTYKRKLGSRAYKAFDEDNMEKAVLAVADKGMKLREAALSFKVPLGTMDVDPKTNEGGRVSKNLISGFAASGIFPVDPLPVLKRLPYDSASREDVTQEVESQLVKFFEEKRFGECGKAPPRLKTKIRLLVEPGKSCAVLSSSSDSDGCEDGGTETGNSTVEDIVRSDSEGGGTATGNSTDIVRSSEDERNSATLESKEVDQEDFVVPYIFQGRGGTSVTKNYVGQVEDQSGEEVNVNFMRRHGVYFVFPDVRDEYKIKVKSILAKLTLIKVCRGRHFFGEKTSTKYGL